MTVFFRTSRSELALHADFVEPAFDLFRESPSLYRRLLARLSSYGVRLADLRMERGDGSLADLHLQCLLFSSRAVARIRIENVNLQCPELSQVDYVSMSQAAVNLLGAVRDHVPAVPFKSFAWTIGLHAILQGTSVRDFVGQFASRTPAGLGPPIGTGLIYYYGPHAENELTAVTLDLSAVVTDGAYIRVHVLYDARKVQAEALPTTAQNRLAEVLDKLGLAVQET